MGLEPYQEAPESPSPLLSCEVIAKRQPAKNQEVGPHQTPQLPVPWTWTSQPPKLGRITFFEVIQAVVFRNSCADGLRHETSWPWNTWFHPHPPSSCNGSSTSDSSICCARSVRQTLTPTESPQAPLWYRASFPFGAWRNSSLGSLTVCLGLAQNTHMWPGVFLIHTSSVLYRKPQKTKRMASECLKNLESSWGLGKDPESDRVSTPQRPFCH